MDTHDTSVRTGEQTHSIIKYSVVEQTEEYTSVKDFGETAVANNADSICSQVIDNHKLITIINLLDDVRGITEPNIELEAQASIKGESLSTKGVYLELPLALWGKLNDIEDNTRLQKSAIIRRCMFRELYAISKTPTFLKDWQTKAIQRTWIDLENELILPKTRFHEIIDRRFVRLPEHTIRAGASDSEFEAFAEEYIEEFHESDLYRDMIEMFGEHAFRNAENVIEEVTDYTFVDSSDTLTLWD